MACEDNNCPEIINSSDVNWDGSLVNVPVTAGSDINAVILALETYFLNLASDTETPVFTLTDPACTGLAAGDYSYQQIVEAIITKMCSISSGLTAIDATDVAIGSITLPSCFSSFIGTDASALFDAIMAKVCEIASRLPPQDTGVVLDDGSTGYTVDPVDADALINNVIHRDTMYSIIENESFIFEHTTPVYSASSLIVDVKDMKAVVKGVLIARRDGKTLSLTGSRDVYVYLDIDGNISTVEQVIGNPEPSTPADNHLIYKFVTDGTGVTSYTARYEDSAFKDPIFSLSPDQVVTSTIKDGNVTGDKLEVIGSAKSAGSPSLITVSIDVNGRVTALTSNLSLSGIADGGILVYNAGLSRFEAGSKLSNGADGYIPLGSAGDLIPSSMSENGSQIQSAKNIEINSGVAESNSEAGLNIVEGTLVVPRMNATTASALAIVDGTFIYVTTTNGTFTSVGFWGAESGAWVKK